MAQTSLSGDGIFVRGCTVHDTSPHGNELDVSNIEVCYGKAMGLGNRETTQLLAIFSVPAPRHFIQVLRAKATILIAILRLVLLRGSAPAQQVCQVIGEGSPEPSACVGLLISTVSVQP
jgi:hypothetical protein